MAGGAGVALPRGLLPRAWPLGLGVTFRVPGVDRKTLNYCFPFPPLPLPSFLLLHLSLPPPASHPSLLLLPCPNLSRGPGLEVRRNDAGSIALRSSTQSATNHKVHTRGRPWTSSMKSFLLQMAQREEAMCPWSKVLCGHSSTGIKVITAPFIDHPLDVRCYARYFISIP